jgi:hypothetical protein
LPRLASTLLKAKILMSTPNKDTCNRKGNPFHRHILLIKDSGITLGVDKALILLAALRSFQTTPMRIRREYKEWLREWEISQFSQREEHSPGNHLERKANQLELWALLITDLITLRRLYVAFQEIARTKTVRLLYSTEIIIVSNRSWIDSNSDYQE